MDSQMVRPHDHSYEHEPHNTELHAVGEGEDGHHHEMKSVLKKVKAKAKKIKDTLRLHRQGHHEQHVHHEGGHVPEDHDLDEEDDEDEEMDDDPAIHGASVFDSAAIGSSVPEQGEKLRDTGTCYGSSAATKDQEDSSQAKVTDSQKSFVPAQEDGGLKVSVDRTNNVKEVPHDPQNTAAAITHGIVEQTKATDPILNFAQEQETIRGQPEIDLEHSTRFEDPDAPKNRPQDHIPSSYETKVTDPTGEGAQTIEVTPTLHRLGKMNLSDESKPEAEGEGDLHTRRHDQSIFSPGSHNQFSPEPTSPITIVSQESPQSVAKTHDPSKSQDHPHANTTEKAPEQSSYTQKISSAPSEIADKAIAAKNVVVSTLGYGEGDNTKEHEIHDEQEKAKPASTVAYGKKIASTVTETGSNLMSKATQTNNEAERRVEGQDKGVSLKEYFSEKLSPGEEDRALSEVISEALHKQKHKTEKTEKKIGKVKESEEVKRDLGSAEENSGERVDPRSASISGSAVVNKLKGLVGSYFGKGTETHSPSQQSLGSSIGNEGYSTSMSEEETMEETAGIRKLSNLNLKKECGASK